VKKKLKNKINRLQFSYRVLIVLTVLNVVAVGLNTHADYYREMYRADYMECTRRADVVAGAKTGYNSGHDSASDRTWTAAFVTCMRMKGYNIDLEGEVYAY